MIYKGLNLLQFQVDELKLYIGLVLLLALSLDRVRHVVAERGESGMTTSDPRHAPCRRTRAPAGGGPRPEFTLVAIALIGFVALAIATDGNMLTSARSPRSSASWPCRW